jgi:hypothetical protein
MTTLSVSPVRVPLRLRLVDAPGRGRLDGAWWPQSRDLAVEFADLADNLPAEFGRIVNLAYSKDCWEPVTTWIRVGSGRLVRTRAFLGTADAQRVLLRLYGQPSLDLMVVPPEFDAGSAARAMEAAALPQNRLPALTLVAEAAASTPDASRWQDDGRPRPT